LPQINQQFIIRAFGGLNVNDQEDLLLIRSHQGVQGGYNQYAPAESPYLKNIDFTAKGIIKRLGSTEESDLTATGENVLLSGDVLVAGCEFFDSTFGVRYELIVSQQTIYIRSDGGSWAQINDSASAAYTHTANVTKCSFAYVDGHLFIGLDGANYIQTFKRGTDLDAQMTTGNTYEESYSVTTHVIEGTWPTGSYLVETIQERLIFSDGNAILYYTPMAYTASSGIWKLGATYFLTQGRIISLDSMTPIFADSLQEILYIGTDQGIEVLTGFDPTADVVSRIKGSKSPLNHQCTSISKTWLIYLTADKNIYAVNKTTIVDIGRRLKNAERTGPLDNLYLNGAIATAFAMYNSNDEQAYFWYPTGSSRYNDTCIAVDMKLGEPVPGEVQSSYEQRVRLLDWQIKTPDDNDWFKFCYPIQGSIIGITLTGKTWTLFGADDDLDTHAVEGKWKSPLFQAGGEDFSKQFMELTIRTVPKGDHNLSVYIYLDRAVEASTTFTLQQYEDGTALWGTAIWGVDVWASTQLLKATNDVDLYSDSIQWQIENLNSEEPFEAANMSLTYLIGAQER
jgi:hypothetical protein